MYMNEVGFEMTDGKPVPIFTQIITLAVNPVAK